MKENGSECSFVWYVGVMRFEWTAEFLCLTVGYIVDICLLLLPVQPFQYLSSLLLAQLLL